jgi:HEAT repeat protein
MIPNDVAPDVRRLMEKMLSGSPVDRVEAIVDARRMGQRATPLIPYLIDNLGNASRVSVGQFASDALAELERLGVKPKRSDGLPPKPPTREAIPDDAPPKLWKLMRNLLCGSPVFRIEAIIDARRMGQRAATLVPYLIANLDNNEKVSVGSFAFYAIYVCGDSAWGKSAVEPLIAALGVERYKGEKRVRIVCLLAPIGDQRAVPAMIRALEDPDRTVRWHTARALGHIPDQQSFEPLMRHLHDPDGGVAGNVVRALGAIGDHRAVEPLVSLLVRTAKDGEPDLRDDAARALGDLGDRRAFAMLLAAYKENEYGSSDRLLRDDALEALGRTKDVRAFDVLRRALEKEKTDDYERVAAVWGLAGLADARSIALMETILKNKRPTEKWWKTGLKSMVRPTAARALVSTGDDGAIDAVMEEYRASPEMRQGTEDSFIDLHFRTAVVDALALSSKPQAYLKVIDILEGTDTQMRREAARVLDSRTISIALSEIDPSACPRRKVPALDDTRVLRALMKVAESTPPSKRINRSALETFRETQEYAVGALRNSGNPEVLTFLEKLEKAAGQSPAPTQMER